MSKKIRLMIITHDLAIGGLQKVVVNICKTINKDMFAVSVLCLRALGSLVPEVERLGIKVSIIPQEKKTDYFSFLKVAHVLQKEKIEVIHTHNTQPFIDGTIGALLSGVRTIVHTDHARSFPDKRRYMFAEWLFSHFAYKIVGVSDHTSKNLMKYEKISSKKILTIPNGIDGSSFATTIDKNKKRIELGIESDSPIIGLCGRLTEEKGITYLLQAMPEIITNVPGVICVIAGEGHLEEHLKREASLLRISGHVRFVGPRLDVPELMKLFDIFVLPSLREGLPMVLLEAMAAGCPIVSTDVGGISTAVQTGYNGTLVRPQNPHELAGAIVRLLEDEPLRRKYAENGDKVFKDNYSAEKMTRKYEQLYLRLI